MNIYRATDPMIVKQMHFDADCDHAAEFYMLDLADLMINKPDSVYVLVIFEGDELIAQTCAVRQDDNNYIWSFNSWSKSSVFDNPTPVKENGKKKNSYAQQMIKEWAIETFGIHEMRCRTFLDPEKLKRIWGWEILSYELNLKF
jgi:hypothetical protein